MPALPLVTSGAGTLLVLLVLIVALAALAGAVIGFLANRTRSSPHGESAERLEGRDRLRRAA